MSLDPYKIKLPAIKSGAVYSFTTHNGVNYEVRFGRKKDNIFNASIVFGVTNEEYDGEEYSLTNKNEVYQVMATIVQIIRLYKREHPNVNTFEYTGEQSAEEKSKNKNIRLALYKRYLPQIFDSNWDIIELENKVILTKNQNLR